MFDNAAESLLLMSMWHIFNLDDRNNRSLCTKYKDMMSVAWHK